MDKGLHKVDTAERLLLDRIIEYLEQRCADEDMWHYDRETRFTLAGELRHLSSSESKESAARQVGDNRKAPSELPEEPIRYAISKHVASGEMRLLAIGAEECLDVNAWVRNGDYLALRSLLAQREDKQ